MVQGQHASLSEYVEVDKLEAKQAGLEAEFRSKSEDSTKSPTNTIAASIKSKFLPGRICFNDIARQGKGSE